MLAFISSSTQNTSVTARKCVSCRYGKLNLMVSREFSPFLRLELPLDWLYDTHSLEIEIFLAYCH